MTTSHALEQPWVLSIIKMLVSNLQHCDVMVEQVTVNYLEFDRSEPKDCYNNAFRFISDNWSHDITYILGYTLVHGIPIQHAWVKVDGQHLDVTLDPGTNLYFKVIEVSKVHLLAYVNDHHHAPDLYDINRFSRRGK